VSFGASAVEHDGGRRAEGGQHNTGGGGGGGGGQHAGLTPCPHCLRTFAPEVVRDPSRPLHMPRERESGPGGLTRAVETPLPSNSPHDPMISRVDRVDSYTGGGNALAFKQPRDYQVMPFQLKPLPCYATQCYGRLGGVVCVSIAN
jgi:hypothetical protein